MEYFSAVTVVREQSFEFRVLPIGRGEAIRGLAGREPCFHMNGTAKRSNKPPIDGYTHTLLTPPPNPTPKSPYKYQRTAIFSALRQHRPEFSMCLHLICSSISI